LVWRIGDAYVNRNRYDIGASVAMFARILSKASTFRQSSSWAATSARIAGHTNLKPDSRISGIESIESAFAARSRISRVIHGSILEFDPLSIGTIDLVLRKVC